MTGVAQPYKWINSNGCTKKKKKKNLKEAFKGPRVLCDQGGTCVYHYGQKCQKLSNSCPQNMASK